MVFRPSEPELRALVDQHEVVPERLYHAAVALQRLHDRGVGHRLDVRDMCEVLGYVTPRRPGLG